MLIRAATSNRVIDRGNASLRALSDDFRRLGVTNLAHRIASVHSHWDTKEDRPGDGAQLNQLIALRNALAHGNQRQVDALRSQGVRDTVSWTRSRMPALNRTARALDKVAWERVHETFDVRLW